MYGSVTLSLAKGLAFSSRFFASLRMTTVNAIENRSNIGVDSASNFTMKNIIIANSPRNAPILVDSFTATDKFPYGTDPYIELKYKCPASKFYIASVIKGIDSELNENFTQEYIAKSINNNFTHNMNKEEKKELKDNIKRILRMEH